MFVLCFLGAVPGTGGSSEPSVFRSPKMIPQDGRAAHGPRHSAMNNPLRPCRGYVSLLVAPLGWVCALLLRFCGLWGWHGVW